MLSASGNKLTEAEGVEARREVGSRRMSLLIGGGSQGCSEFITNLLQMLSWDMPANKASFVAKDRTLGWSAPSLTEMLCLTFLALQSWAA